MTASGCMRHRCGEAVIGFELVPDRPILRRVARFSLASLRLVAATHPVAGIQVSGQGDTEVGDELVHHALFRRDIARGHRPSDRFRRGFSTCRHRLPASRCSSGPFRVCRRNDTRVVDAGGQTSDVSIQEVRRWPSTASIVPSALTEQPGLPHRRTLSRAGQHEARSRPISSPWGDWRTDKRAWSQAKRAITVTSGGAQGDEFAFAPCIGSCRLRPLRVPMACDLGLGGRSLVGGKHRRRS